MTNTLSEATGAPATPEADFDVTVTFAAAPAAVFDAVTTASGVTAWWTEATGSGLQGGELVFTFGTDRVVVRVEAERPSRVQWAVLVSDPLPDWVGTSIIFDITSTETGGTSLRFRHMGLLQLECVDVCTVAWPHYLRSLVAYVDHGAGFPGPRSQG